MALSSGWHIVLACFAVKFPSIIFVVHYRGVVNGDVVALQLAQRWTKVSARCCSPSAGPRRRRRRLARLLAHRRLSGWWAHRRRHLRVPGWHLPGRRRRPRRTPAARRHPAPPCTLGLRLVTGSGGVDGLVPLRSRRTNPLRPAVRARRAAPHRVGTGRRGHAGAGLEETLRGRPHHRGDGGTRAGPSPSILALGQRGHYRGRRRSINRPRSAVARRRPSGVSVSSQPGPTSFSGGQDGLLPNDHDMSIGAPGTPVTKCSFSKPRRQVT